MKRKLHLIVTSYRREISATLLGITAIILIGQLRSEPSLPNVITIATRQLSAGTVIGSGDLRTLRVPETIGWKGSLNSVQSAIGKKLVRSLSAGQPVTAGDFFGPAFLTGIQPGLQAVALPSSAVTNAALATVGNRVDIYASPREFGASTTLVAHDVGVLVAASENSETVFADKPNSIPLTVAVTQSQAQAIAKYIGSSVFSIAVLS